MIKTEVIVTHGVGGRTTHGTAGTSRHKEELVMGAADDSRRASDFRTHEDRGKVSYACRHDQQQERSKV